MSIIQNHPIRSLNSWRLGSTVAYYAEPKQESALIACYESQPQTKHGMIFLGLGSNVMFPDTQLDAYLIRMRHLNAYHFDGELIEAQCGLTLAKLAKACTKQGMADAAYLAGIPGMLGGALVMNAGAHQQSIWEHVVSVRAFTDKGVETLYPSDFDIGYRTVRYRQGKLHCFLSAVLKFTPTCPGIAHQRMKQLLHKRNSVQPIGTYNCGCVFHNVGGKSIGKMLEDAGLKGFRIGDAQVSNVHANFIENIAQKATTRDTQAVIAHMRYVLQDVYQVEVKTEVVMYD